MRRLILSLCMVCAMGIAVMAQQDNLEVNENKAEQVKEADATIAASTLGATHDAKEGKACCSAKKKGGEIGSPPENKSEEGTKKACCSSSKKAGKESGFQGGEENNSGEKKACCAGKAKGDATGSVSDDAPQDGKKRACCASKMVKATGSSGVESSEGMNTPMKEVQE